MPSNDVSAALAQIAARNNAELCELVCRAHGVGGAFTADAWSSAGRTPEYYPDAVTLSRTVDAASLVARIDDGRGASVKDSFAVLDLSGAGYRILFSAEWIARAPDIGRLPDVYDPVRWTAVADADTLVEWVRAWSDDGMSHGQFPPSLLAESELVILRGAVGDATVAGAILNAGERVVGVSNLFSMTADAARTWTGCLAQISDRFPGFGVVGYESGAALDAALHAGFQAVGPLRVWIKD